MYRETKKTRHAYEKRIVQSVLNREGRGGEGSGGLRTLFVTRESRSFFTPCWPTRIHGKRDCCMKTERPNDLEQKGRKYVLKEFFANATLDLRPSASLQHQQGPCHSRRIDRRTPRMKFCANAFENQKLRNRAETFVKSWNRFVISSSGTEMRIGMRRRCERPVRQLFPFLFIQIA